MEAYFISQWNKKFHYELANRPYRSESEYRAELLGLMAAHLCLGCASVSENGQQDGFLSGAALQTNQVVPYLLGYPHKAFPTDGETILLFVRAWEAAANRLQLTPGADSYRLEKIRRLFSLDEFGFFCLIGSLCCQTDRGCGAGYTMLHGQEQPTLELLRSLYGMIFPKPSPQKACFCAGGDLASLLFLPREQSSPLLSPLALRAHVTSYLLERDYRGEALSDGYQFFGGTPEEPLLFCQEQEQKARALLTEARASGESCLLVLCGPAGSGKKLTLRHLSGALNRQILFMPAARIPGETADLSELLLYALLEEYLLCIELSDPEGPERVRLERLLQVLAPYGAAVAVVTQRLRRGLTPVGYVCCRITYPFPTQKQAVLLWEAFSRDLHVGKDLDWQTISNRFSLTPGQIRRALREASLEAGAGELTGALLRDAVLRGNTSRLSELADRIEVFYGWDDLVLADYAKEQLRTVCNRVKYRFLVDEQWGFEKKSAYGKGISILLYGPPGTGKTMSAQVLAGELWLPLYRINLAQIISKYIGETAKNLDAIFHEASNSNVILFFDEADALFAKRTDIQNSNDRYSNSETSYLLQKMEEFSGISILATNLANNFDDAFRRRIHYMINIHMPSGPQRLTLWQKAFAKDAPLDGDIDFDLLADSLEISGSVIKSAALQAAYFAAAQSRPIGMNHLVLALRAELVKTGKTEPRCLQLFATDTLRSPGLE